MSTGCGPWLRAEVAPGPVSDSQRRAWQRLGLGWAALAAGLCCAGLGIEMAILEVLVASGEAIGGSRGKL